MAAHGLLLVQLLELGVPLVSRDLSEQALGSGSGDRLQVQLIETADESPVAYPPDPLTPTLALEAPRVVVTEPSVELPAPGASPDEGLFGLYRGQLRARIERARQTIEPNAAPLPRACSAQITQDERGNVLDVVLEGCGAEGPSRMQLERAVRAASPLPAPPAALARESRVEVVLGEPAS
jgi:hypothetical protein